MATTTDRIHTTANGTQIILSGDSLTMNMGPQHPSTHGVLRLVLDLEGETVVHCKPVIGYLHTGFEKTFEQKTYMQGVVLTDRMDYLAPLSNNLVYALAVEKLLGVDIPPRATVLRVLLAELTRINNHLVWLGTQALDLGAMSVFLYCFREREVLLDLFEMMSGARMMTSFIRPGGLMADVPPGWLEKCDGFIRDFPEHIVEYESLLTDNDIFKERTIGIGKISLDLAHAMDLTGPSLRACGESWDLRKIAPYCGYEEYDFDVPTLTGGDVYDRYMVRVAELRESTKIARQALDRLPDGPIITADRKVALPPRAELATSMEALIHHFKLVSEGFRPPEGEVYLPIESPKGEIGIYLVSDGTGRPYRVHVRAPSFVNLQSLPVMSEGGMIADLVAIIGSIDPVLGEVDR
jgi:NADH-quinone oxidoreductase subunit D